VTLFRGTAEILASAWRTSRWRLVAIFAVVAVNYASWPLAPLVMRRATNAVVAHDVHGATVAAAFLPLLAFVNAIGWHVLHVLFVELADRNNVAVTSEVAELAQSPPGLAHLERADYADRLELIRHETGWRYMAIRSAVTAIGIVIQLVFTVILLARLEPLLLLLLVFAVAPLLGTRFHWQTYEKAWIASADKLRRASHLIDLALRADAAKEVRVFGLDEELRARLRTARAEIRDALFRADLKGTVASSAGYLVFAVGYVGALLVVVRGAVRGTQTVGDVVLAVGLAAQTNRLVFDAVESTQRLRRAARAAERLRWLRELVRSLHRPSEAAMPAPARLERGIRLDAVSFRYPGTDADVLRDVDLEPAGKTVAFVGENGAGKTTLVKLLCRFYEPSEGRVLVDGVDLGRIEPAEWRRRIAAGFQDFVRFELVARESVGVGELPLVDDPAAVERAVERAAATDVVADLRDRLETPLGKTLPGGVELSGGQWQKLALARAMMRERPLLLILDEPTSSLDAHAEHMLFEQYAQSAEAVARATGGIAVFVSHRFSTVRMADRIVVVEGGRIAEQGTHDELVAHGGIYAELFALQAAAYG